MAEQNENRNQRQGTSNRGFASMNQARHREVSRQGGLASSQSRQNASNRNQSGQGQQQGLRNQGSKGLTNDLRSQDRERNPNE